MNKILSMPYEEYESFVKSIIKSNQFRSRVKMLKVRYLSKDIEQKYLNIEFLFDFSDEFASKLININVKNRVVFRIKSMLFKLQVDFIKSGDIDRLKFIDKKEFIDWYRKDYDRYLDASILSKIINNNSFKIANKVYLLKILLPSKVHINYQKINKILQNNPSLSDNKLQLEFNKIYSENIGKNQIRYIRKKFLIPPYSDRKNFNIFYPPSECDCWTNRHSCNIALKSTFNWNHKLQTKFMLSICFQHS